LLRPNYDDPAVREGALLRIASDLLVPFGELGNFDRQELLEWLAQLGIEPAAGTDRLGPFWIEGVCPGPEPKDEVTILRSDGDWWVVGYWERGSFRIDHRFGSEADACQWMLHHLVSHQVTSMGTTKVPPHVREGFEERVLEALEEVATLIRQRRGADASG
jgi:hypothetical protein